MTETIYCHNAICLHLSLASRLQCTLGTTREISAGKLTGMKLIGVLQSSPQTTNNLMFSFYKQKFYRALWKLTSKNSMQFTMSIHNVPFNHIVRAQKVPAWTVHAFCASYRSHATEERLFHLPDLYNGDCNEIKRQMINKNFRNWALMSGSFSISRARARSLALSPAHIVDIPTNAIWQKSQVHTTQININFVYDMA